MNLSSLAYLVAFVLFLLLALSVTVGSVPLLASGLTATALGLLVQSLGDRRIG